jgi:translation initiation factor 2B subunit (eIF-2B alpha/beta/delta family)
MAAQILSSVTSHRHRLHIVLIPDCAIGTAVRNIDIVLLGADRISSTGNVSNKIGSLCAALCAKQLGKDVTVLALSDADKIAVPGADNGGVERHPRNELTSAWHPDTRNTLDGEPNFEVSGEWFEWVPANLVDVYVTDIGVLTTKEVEQRATWIDDLEKSLFGEDEEQEIDRMLRERTPL